MSQISNKSNKVIVNSKVDKLTKKIKKLNIQNVEIKTLSQFIDESEKNTIERRNLIKNDVVDYKISDSRKSISGWEIHVTNHNLMVKDENGEDIPLTKHYDLIELNPFTNEYCFFVKHKTEADKLVKYSLEFLC